MTSNCTDTSNDDYKIFWFDYFVSIGYIDNSDLVNLYAPYGKCTRSLLWLTYLINIVHYFFLSTGILYLLCHHRNQSGFWWPFINWIVSFIFIVSSVILFVFLNLNINLFSILIITVQISTLLILWISIFIVIVCMFAIEYRYQRCLILFIIILFLIQICCFIIQILITFHCLYNLKFRSSFLDYGYWSAIFAAGCTVISTILLDYIFMWRGQRTASTRVSPALIGVSPTPVIQQNNIEDRATSPVDSIILEDFCQQPEAASHQIYNNNDYTRHFRIQRINQRSDSVQSNNSQNQECSDERNANNLLTADETEA
ncbi:unnamed protein product [Adineta steineri]|uniref:Uncharacterized protein n=1 Tax=Adineta steineri TaxID=433720 RepID=A0A818Q5G8_9BILA|nr:unnamed protein product [Adineta steineri]CAF3634174.1 unnamed protein product [Adineta steineri]